MVRYDSGVKFGAEVKHGRVYNALTINVLQIAMRLTPAFKRGLSAEVFVYT